MFIRNDMGCVEAGRAPPAGEEGMQQRRLEVVVHAFSGWPAAVVLGEIGVMGSSLAELCCLTGGFAGRRGTARDGNSQTSNPVDLAGRWDKLLAFLQR
jgi:hypothetical protein